MPEKVTYEEFDNAEDDPELKEFQDVCRPVVEYLQTKCDPHTRIIIEWDRVSLNYERLGIPVDIPD